MCFEVSFCLTGHSGEQWHQTKRDHPEQLKSPMRVVMFQHLLESVLTEFMAMMDSPSSRSSAQNQDLLLPNGRSRTQPLANM